VAFDADVVGVIVVVVAVAVAAFGVFFVAGAVDSQSP